MKKFITVENDRVQLIHYMPFDSVNGLGKSEAQLIQEGYLLDTIPDPERIAGKNAVAMYNEVDGFHYVYEDINTQEGSKLRQALADGIITKEQFLELTK